MPSVSAARVWLPPQASRASTIRCPSSCSILELAGRTLAVVRDFQRAADAPLVMAEGCDGPFAVLAGERDAPRSLRAPEPAQRRFQYACLPPQGSPEAHAMDGTR